MSNKMNRDEFVSKISSINNPPIPNYKLEHPLKLSLEGLGINKLNIL